MVVENVRPKHWSRELYDRCGRQAIEVDRLKAEVERLSAENAFLRSESGQAADGEPMDRKLAIASVRTWVGKLVARKEREEVDQPKLASQLKWYLIAHSRLMAAFIEDRLYSACYEIVSDEVSKLRSRAWREHLAERQSIHERVAMVNPDVAAGVASDRFTPPAVKAEYAEIAVGLGLDPAIVLAPKYSTNLHVLRHLHPTSEDQARENESAQLQRIAEIEQGEKDKCMAKLQRWATSKSVWATYPVTVAAHDTRPLWRLDAISLDSVIGRLERQRRELDLFHAIRAGLPGDKLVGEHYEPGEIEAMAETCAAAA